MKSSLNISKYHIIYYLALVLAYFYLMRPDSELPLILRVLMLGLTFVPVVFKMNLLPFAVLCFYSVSSTSFCNVLPTTTSYYVIVVLALYLLYNRKGHFLTQSLVVLAYYLLISLLHFDLDESLAWLFIAILLADMIQDENGLVSVFYAFIVVSIFLSLLYFLHYGDFARQYGSHELDLEQSGWINPNTYGAAIGAGAVLCVAYLTRVIRIPQTKLLTIVTSVTIALSFVAITLNASRGAFVAFVIPSFIMMMTTRTKLWVKIIVALISVGFVFWMLSNNMFELLSTRMADDTFGTGGGRTSIWQRKISVFFNQDNPFYILFGMGQTGCNNLGSYISTHNDLVTAFIAYGVVGLVIFIYSVFIYPFKVASKANKWTVLFLLVFLLIECCVLEPFFRGKIFILMYYMFTLKYAMIYSDNSIFIANNNRL